jgi:CheY-like chemotaxis protein
MPTILIVDDDSAMRAALDEAARDLGFDTPCVVRLVRARCSR